MKLLTKKQRERLLKNGARPRADHKPVVRWFNPTAVQPGSSRSWTPKIRTSPTASPIWAWDSRNSAAYVFRTSPPSGAASARHRARPALPSQVQHGRLRASRARRRSHRRARPRARGHRRVRLDRSRLTAARSHSAPRPGSPGAGRSSFRHTEDSIHASRPHRGAPRARRPAAGPAPDGPGAGARTSRRSSPHCCASSSVGRP